MICGCEIMSENKIILSLNDLLEARFRQFFRGYNQQDVDGFIDSVRKVM